MTTLIMVVSSNGKKSQCDGRCYLAENEKCNCVCAGQNHGVGLTKACENVRRDGTKMGNAFAERIGITDYEIMVNVSTTHQMRLPMKFKMEGEMIQDNE